MDGEDIENTVGPMPEWARAHEVINAIREDMSKRIEGLQYEVNSKIEEMEHCKQVLFRIDNAPLAASASASAPPPYPTGAAIQAKAKRW